MNLSPEIKAALQQLLSDTEGGPPSHPDAPQDMKMVLDVMEEKLTPVFEHIGKQFQAYESRIAELESLVSALITSMSDAVSGHRRTGIMASVKEKYGADLDSIGPIYSDMTGEDLTEALIDAFEQDGGEMDEAIPRLLGPIKERFGKYSRKEEPAPAQGELELNVETKPEEPKAETSEPVPEEPKEEKPKKASDGLFETMGKIARKTA